MLDKGTLFCCLKFNRILGTIDNVAVPSILGEAEDSCLVTMKMQEGNPSKEVNASPIGFQADWWAKKKKK